jgi:hypothetical protein
MLAPQLRELQESREFRELVGWHEGRETVVAGQPYYLLPAARLPRALRELKLLIESRLSGA